MSSSGLHGYQVHKWCPDAHAGKIPRLIKYEEKKISFENSMAEIWKAGRCGVRIL